LVRVDGMTAAVEVRWYTDHLHALARTAQAIDGDPLFHGGNVRSGVRILPRKDNPAEAFPIGHSHSPQSPVPCTSPSAAGRRFLTQELATQLGCSADDLSISGAQRRGSPPRVTLRGVLSPIDVSLSHHGRFVAFMFAVPRFPSPSLPE
jgi:hypothetical protein